MTSSPPPPSPSPYILSQEEHTSEETRTLLSTLPRERGWVANFMYLYEGFWYSAGHLQALIACQTHFQALENDTVLVTSPKCGTTWLKAMAFALTTRSTLALDNNSHHPLVTTNPHDLVPSFEINLYRDKDNVPDLSSALASPRLFGTHLPIGSLPRPVIYDPSCKIVYLCRNPKDTFVSLWHFTNRLRPELNELGDVFRRFCDGESNFGPFWDHVLEYWEASQKSPRKVLFLKYEEIKEQPAGQLRRLAEFLGCPFLPGEEREGKVGDILRLCSFDHLSNLEVNKTGRFSTGPPNSSFFRKGQVGDWVNLLTPEMIEKIDRITEMKLRGSQFKF